MLTRCSLPGVIRSLSPKKPNSLDLPTAVPCTEKLLPSYASHPLFVPLSHSTFSPRAVRFSDIRHKNVTTPQSCTVVSDQWKSWEEYHSLTHRRCNGCVTFLWRMSLNRTAWGRTWVRQRHEKRMTGIGWKQFFRAWHRGGRYQWVWLFGTQRANWHLAGCSAWAFHWAASGKNCCIVLVPIFCIAQFCGCCLLLPLCKSQLPSELDMLSSERHYRTS